MVLLEPFIGFQVIRLVQYQQTVSECLEVIETEAVAEKPKKGIIKTALSALQTVKGVAEFGAAVATLVEFISPLL